MAKFEIEEIYWVDSAGQKEDGWLRTENNFKDYEDFFSKSVFCRTIGYVIYEDVNTLVLAGSLGEEAFENEKEFEFSGMMRIPKVCIQERKKPGS
jgi:hypothetical protein